jgi:hypothetical protein
MSSEGEQYLRDFTALEEDADGWRNPMAFEGDFYREPDNVVRGVQMKVDEAMMPPGMGSDFYHNPVDLKGSGYADSSIHAFMTDSLGSGGLLPYSDSDPFFQAGAPFKEFGAGYDDPDDLMLLKHHPTLDLPERFTPIDEPPLPPTDEYWKFEVTTIHLKTERAKEGYKIGNHLMAFLQTKVVSSIRKVREPSKTYFQKFSIKADV